jgi:hypothetical protein
VLQNLFANPTYAGAYVYGVRSTDRRRQKAGPPGTGRRSLRAEEAEVFLPDRMPAYITWDQYQRNQTGGSEGVCCKGVAPGGAAGEPTFCADAALTAVTITARSTFLREIGDSSSLCSATGSHHRGPSRTLTSVEHHPDQIA